MKWIRIGRFEFYKAPEWNVSPCNCGCLIVCAFGYGVTWLSKECRAAQGSKFFEIMR